MSWQSAHHNDVPWCMAGPVVILYHASINVSTSVSYDQRSVFGSHGAYAVWLGTEPRSYSVSSNLVAANSGEVAFNITQVVVAHQWTQESPPTCMALKSPMTGLSMNEAEGGVMVRIEGYDSSVDEATHLDNLTPIQISLGLTLKECKPI